MKISLYFLPSYDDILYPSLFTYHIPIIIVKYSIAFPRTDNKMSNFKSKSKFLLLYNVHVYDKVCIRYKIKIYY